jgi:hypothetical protein
MVTDQQWWDSDQFSRYSSELCSIPGRGNRLFSSPQRPDRLWDPPYFLTIISRRVGGVKRPKPEAEHSPASNAEFKKCKDIRCWSTTWGTRTPGGTRRHVRGTWKHLTGYVKSKNLLFCHKHWIIKTRFRVSHRTPGRKDFRLTGQNHINNW